VTAPAGEELLEVHILHFPLAVFERSRRHTEELLREFEFIAEGVPQPTPARLLQLVQSLTERFGGLNTDTEERVESAVARGDASIDLVYSVPAVAAEASKELLAMLDEADDFCRHGDLLTLVTPADQIAFRRWYLDEFINQLAGGTATPWSGPA
jgi:hypothetical protein